MTHLLHAIIDAAVGWLIWRLAHKLMLAIKKLRLLANSPKMEPMA